MGKPLRVLIVEDSEDDAELLVDELRQGGYEPAFERVDTPEAMNKALEKRNWDVVIADYVMPTFSGLAALDLLKARGIDLPFIMVSGKVGEGVIVETLKAGAQDYVLKDNLTRLLPAVKRELQDAEVRQQRRRLEEERVHLLEQLRSVNERLTVTSVQLKEAEELCQRQVAEMDAMISSVAEAVVVFGPSGETNRINSVAIDLLGLSPKEQSKPAAGQWDLLRPETEKGDPFPPEDAPPIRALRGETVRGVVARIHRASDKKPIWVSISASPFRTHEAKTWSAVAIFTDITQLQKERGVTGLKM